MLDEKFIGKKKNRIEDESNDCYNLQNRDKLALEFYELSKKTNNLIEKQSYLKKAYYLNNTRCEIVENYLNILKKNGINKDDKEFLSVSNVYNILNKKCNRDDVIKFFDELTDIETYKEFENTLKEKLNKIGDDIDVFNQPFNITFNSNLYYNSLIIKFIKNYLNIKKKMLSSIYKNKEKMFEDKIKTINRLKNFLDIKHGYNIEYILFYISSYFTSEEILNLLKMFLDDKKHFDLNDFKELLEKKKLETLVFNSSKKKKKRIDLSPRIENNELIFNDEVREIKLSNFENYSYKSIIDNLYTKGTISYKDMKFSKVLNNHYFSPYLNFLKKLLKNILGTKVIKTYIKYYLKNVLKVDEKYCNILLLNYDEIWDNINFLPIFSKAFLALTDKMNLKVYFSCLKMNNDNFLIDEEVEKFINIAIFVLYFLHEIVGHYFRFYLRYLTTDEIGKKYSFDSKDEENNPDEGGFYLEEKLFGEIIDKINLNESLFILDTKNYDCDFDQFKENFKSVRYNNKNIEINNLSDYLKDFYNTFNFEEESEIKEIKNVYISIKFSGKMNNTYLSFRNYGVDTFPILK